MCENTSGLFCVYFILQSYIIIVREKTSSCLTNYYHSTAFRGCENSSISLSETIRNQRFAGRDMDLDVSQNPTKGRKDSVV